jgi:hypothetical protein
MDFGPEDMEAVQACLEGIDRNVPVAVEPAAATERGVQIASSDEFGDQLLRGCLVGSSNNFGHGVLKRPIEPTQGT